MKTNIARQPKKAEPLRLDRIEDLEPFALATGRDLYRFSLAIAEHPSNLRNIVTRGNCTMKIWGRIRAKAFRLAKAEGFSVDE